MGYGIFIIFSHLDFCSFKQTEGEDKRTVPAINENPAPTGQIFN